MAASWECSLPSSLPNIGGAPLRDIVDAVSVVYHVYDAEDEITKQRLTSALEFSAEAIIVRRPSIR